MIPGTINEPVDSSRLYPRAAIVDDKRPGSWTSLGIVVRILVIISSSYLLVRRNCMSSTTAVLIIILIVSDVFYVLYHEFVLALCLTGCTAAVRTRSSYISHLAEKRLAHRAPRHVYCTEPLVAGVPVVCWHTSPYLASMVVTAIQSCDR